MAVREWVEEESWRGRGRACLAVSAIGGDVHKRTRPTECPVRSVVVHLKIRVSVVYDFVLESVHGLGACGE